MINKHKQVICDLTKIILEDKVCLLSGYVEVKKGRLLVHYSDDPNNKVQKPGILKNRKEFRRVEDRGKASKKLEGKHFIDLDCYFKYLAKLDKKPAK